MKKLHIVLLIVTVTMALFSAYSLAAINQVYKIDFKWYSEYKQSFSDKQREAVDEKWFLDQYPDEMITEIITDKIKVMDLKDENTKRNLETINFNFNEDILLYFSLGTVKWPEYKIKVLDIAQRGNVVEVKLSLNSPIKIDEFENIDSYSYHPNDIIRISKDAFPIKGKLYFIFKNQAGIKIGERRCDI
jgi:hypothetical protein